MTRLAFTLGQVLVSLLQIIQLSCANLVAPSTAAQKYSRVILKTSSIPDFSSLQTRENGTWESKGFSVKNISVLLKEHYTISPPPSVTSNEGKVDPGSDSNSNSSQVFCSNKSASLSIIIKDFRHPVMFLNFSYFIDKTDTESVVRTSTEPSEHTFLTYEALEETSDVDKNTSISSTSSELKPIPEEKGHYKGKLDGINPASILTELVSRYYSVDDETVSEVPPTSRPKPNSRKMIRTDRLVPAESARSYQEGIVSTPAPPPPERSRRRRRRSTNVKNSQHINASASRKPPSPISSRKSASSSALSTNSSTATPVSPLTLVQAVEVIKNAAAVVAAAGIAPTTSSSTGTSSDNGNGNSIPGNMPISKKSKTNGTNENTKGPSQDGSAIPAEYKTGEEGNNSKTDKVKNEKRNGKHKSSSSTTKHENEDEGIEKVGDSSSSSSSSEEEDGETRKKKISYKTWRASLEKKNRPPGLYVTVNDDIVFDNWDGIWDKHNILGKWTGAKASPKEAAAWNQTYIFMSWDDVPTGHDVKITFEWEPIDTHSHIILSDIVVSTIAMSSNCAVSNHDMDEEPAKVSNIKHESDKPNSTSISSPNEVAFVMLGDQPVPEKKLEENNITSFVILQRNAEGKATWNFLKMDKSKANEYKNLSLEGLLAHENGAHAKDIDAFKKVLEDFVEKGFPVKDKFSEGKTTVPEPKGNIPLQNKSGNTNVSSTSTASETIRASETPSIDKNTGNNSTEKVIDEVPSVSSMPNPLTSIQTQATTDKTPSTVNISTPITSTTLSAASTSIVPNDKPLQRRYGIPTKKTDGKAALLMTVITGCIALAILAVVIKKRIDIAIKGRNATR